MDSKIPIYCLKCKKYTENDDIREDSIMVKNIKRRLIIAICSVCKSKKSRFLKFI